ncbi:glycosyltransferase family 4 protein [Methylocapsa palsarum]|uniref:Glycosyltransferase involved in cell wall bisynthesis n=1 Tax=Methylocapsa palsarum TaxID=1612308 RepID=A0A1I4C322_9HYPH|nr:glycosyltransferase family 1 protein [Methylocapsa palsarum]SFK75335.1 Glycosyltransferase involved in cell wall bisynthesis [Methylocapsa palsarum]
MKRILVVTDTWRPQVNGVVRSLEALSAAALELGASVQFLSPQGFRSFRMPTYPELRLALTTAGIVGRRIEALSVDHVHIATEGPLGFAARRYCLRNDICFTTSYHTKFPEYVSARAFVPKSLVYRCLRWFHNAGSGVFVSTDSLAADLEARGFKQLMHWSRGVDHDRFRMRETSVLDFPRPIFLSVGRLAVEKNLKAFLDLDLPGTKVLVGDGPDRAKLEAAYPQARFLGSRSGDELAEIYSSADVFVFPSMTDTFGMVLLEAMASGLPVAAFPVPGPLDVVGESGAGVLDEDLRSACLKALWVPPWKARAHAETFSWQASARQFLENLSAVDPSFTIGLANT